jgi:hypothetical protein
MRHCNLRALLIGGLFATALAVMPLASRAQIGISITVAPPVLPVYVQPAIPAPGYLWVPGYWAWSDDGGYYWVPGTWVEPPQPGLLWTPGYWGWVNGAYLWHGGYWGAHVGFYGGVNYGFGYGGSGYAGGYWSHGAFFYNRSVNRIGVGVHIVNVYERPVPAVNVHVSFNGGVGGIQAHATAAELSAGRERHFEPVVAQRQQEQLAGRNPALRESNNHGHPGIAATARPGRFSGAGVIAARGAPAHANIAHHGAGPSAVVRNRAAGGRENAAGRPAEAPRNENAGRAEEAPRNENAGRAGEAPRNEQHAAPRPQPQEHRAAPNARPQQQRRGGEPAAHRDERKPPR